MTTLLIISFVFVGITYRFTHHADRLTLEDSMSAYKAMELAIIAGFIAYMTLCVVAILLYLKT